MICNKFISKSQKKLSTDVHPIYGKNLFQKRIHYFGPLYKKVGSTTIYFRYNIFLAIGKYIFLECTKYKAKPQMWKKHLQWHLLVPSPCQY